MCIRDSCDLIAFGISAIGKVGAAYSANVKTLDEYYAKLDACLLYTSDAADERSSVDLGGRRIIKKKNKETSMMTAR